jgi:hypothetical protein
MKGKWNMTWKNSPRCMFCGTTWRFRENPSIRSVGKSWVCEVCYNRPSTGIQDTNDVLEFVERKRKPLPNPKGGT